MSLSLQAFELSIDCDGKELEMYDVKQEGPNSMRAFVASEAGKVSITKILLASRLTVDTSNSKSQLKTNYWTLTLALACVSTGSGLTVML